MARVVRRQVVWLLLSGYLFSTTAASLFHSHGKAGQFGSALCWDACGLSSRVGGALCGCGLVNPALQAAVGRGCSEGSSEHDCAVCRFLAQKVAAEPLIEAVSSEALCDRTISAAPSCPIHAPVFLHYSRAPPSVV